MVKELFKTTRKRCAGFRKLLAKAVRVLILSPVLNTTKARASLKIPRRRYGGYAKQLVKGMAMRRSPPLASVHLSTTLYLG
jgi:hypothetical protein